MTTARIGTENATSSRASADPGRSQRQTSTASATGPATASCAPTNSATPDSPASPRPCRTQAALSAVCDSVSNPFSAFQIMFGAITTSIAASAAPEARQPGRAAGISAAASPAQTGR